MNPKHLTLDDLEHHLVEVARALDYEKDPAMRTRLLNERSSTVNAISEKREAKTYLRSIADDPAHVDAVPDRGTPPATPEARADRDRALRVIDRNADLHVGDSAERVERLVRSGDPTGVAARYIDAVAAPAYLSAFGKMVVDPAQGHLRFSPDEVEAVRRASAVEAERAMSIGTGSAGGFAVPYVLDPSILMSGSGATNPVRQIARNITISGARDWKGVSSDGVSAAYVAEATEATDASPVLAQPAISTAQWRVFVPFSIELGQDWPELQTELVRLAEDARSVLDATQFLTGSGTNAPQGVLTGLTTTQRVQTNAVATYAVGDPWLLKAALPARFVGSTTFAANPATWDTTYRFVGGNSTEPLQMPTRDGAFLGRPKVEWSTMATGTTTGTKLIVGGDFSNYLVVDRLGTTAELVPHLFGPTSRFPLGQRGLYIYGRTGAGCLVQNAFRYMEVK
jgi:HK97 family phage major capsid protein